MKLLLSLLATATLIAPAFAHESHDAPPVASTTGEHVHIHTPGPAAAASLGVSSPDDEEYGVIDALLPPPKRTATLLAEANQCRIEKLAQDLPKLVPVTANASAEPQMPVLAKPVALQAPKVVKAEKVAAAEPAPPPAAKPAVKPAVKLSAKKPAKPVAEPVTTASIKPVPKPAKKLQKKKKPVAVSTELY
jgi:hypothetical protein